MISETSVSGILLIDKPSGWTSHDVVAKVRRVLGTKKVGHAGTLDPMATGVLVILVGKATKLSDSLLNEEKAYTAEVLLGQGTDTGDAEGQVVVERPVPELTDMADLVTAIEPLLGTREQMVPAYSAVKVGGKKLYESARKGQAMVERPVKMITIESMAVEFESATKLQMRVICSKGTYIRVLAEELAANLGTVGHLTALRRTRSGQFAVEDCVALEELINHPQPQSLLRDPAS